MNRSAHYALIALLSATLYNCGGSENIKPNSHTAKTSSSKSTTAEKQPGTSTKKSAPTQIAADVFNQAQRKNSPEKETLLLRAAELFLDENKTDSAQAIIQSLQVPSLTANQRMDYTSISAEIFLKRGDLESARALLNKDSLERELKNMEPAQELRWRDARAQLLERSGLFEDSINERISMAALITQSAAANENQELLWQTLMQLPMQKLQTLAQQGQGGIAQGWYQLALIGKNYRIDFESQQKLLNKWLTQWRNHPAANNLPSDLQIAQHANKQQPKKIALLLPLSGKLMEAGEAVRDGFFAAYYQTADLNHTPKINLYDTNRGATDAYQQAVGDGAELIVGPLDREDVNSLARNTTLSVPVLSLNYVDQPITNTATTISNATTTISNKIPNLIQFGLASEDEARQAARQAFADGYKNAVIVSNGLDWSERAANAFNQEWQNLKGISIGKISFVTQDKFAESFRALMLINESQMRMQLLQQQIGLTPATKFEFTARRRADVDVIFLAVTPTQGRQIKPTLAFYFADKIPTYATSSIYSGDADATNNEDLNGVLFSTLPWLFDADNPEKKSIASQTKTSAIFGRLQALGADAFHLCERLNQLKEAPDARIYGATGAMHLLDDGRIEREQTWAHFANGLAEPVASTLLPDATPGEDQ